MADNIAVTEGSGKTVATKEIGTAQHQRVIAHGELAQPSANFTRPANTTAYAAGDLVANSTTAASVTPLTFTAARYNGGSGFIRGGKLKKSTATLTSASFRLHLYTQDPTATDPTNGDNGAWVTTDSGYFGFIDFTIDKVMQSSATIGFGASGIRSELPFIAESGSQAVYGLLEALGAYTPGSGEVFTVTLDVFQN